jgi:hypothetical protein
VFIHWTYKAEKSVEDVIREPLVRQYWDELSKKVRQETRQRYFEEQWKKSSGIDEFSFIMSKTTEVSSPEMGVTPGPVEENHNLVQPPLSPEDKTVKWVNPKTQYPKFSIR